MSTLIRLDRVWRTYRTGPSLVHALRDATFILESGTFTLVVGRSGSGKSTLLHLLAGMDRPTQGTLRVDGHDLARLSGPALARYRRETIGLVFQRFHLLPLLSALENVALPLTLAGAPRAQRRDRAAELLERVGLVHRLTHRPDQLSGGEQQRVAIARALAHDPPLLLADEPTGNLDAQTAAGIVALLREIHASGRSVLVVTHAASEFHGAATETLHLHDGTVTVSSSKPAPHAAA